VLTAQNIFKHIANKSPVKEEAKVIFTNAQIFLNRVIFLRNIFRSINFNQSFPFDAPFSYCLLLLLHQYLGHILVSCWPFSAAVPSSSC
jgi:hypothetical protein